MPIEADRNHILQPKIFESDSHTSNVDATRRLARLKADLRRERARGTAGHWTYDLTRHLALVRKVRQAERLVGGSLSPQTLSTQALSTQTPSTQAPSPRLP